MAASSNNQSTPSNVYQYWKQFDLTSLQKELDEKASEIANRQDESEVSRKKLVDLCRDFKKNSPEDAKKMATPVLKSFQIEVDNLFKRSKAAEAAFLSLYKRIVESPDPTPALELSTAVQKKVQKLSDLEVENANLKETLDQYNREFAEVKNQDITIRQLKEKIKSYDEQMESMVKAKLAEREQILTKTFEEREKRLLENEQILHERLKESENRSESLQISLNAAHQELYQLRSRNDELGSARSSEMDMLISDLDKANLRAATAERECEMLKDTVRQLTDASRSEELDTSRDDDEQNNLHIRQSAERELAVKDRQISHLLDEISHLKTKYDAETAELEKKIEDMAKQSVQKSQNLQALEEKLNLHNDCDEIKRELNVLKTVCLGGGGENLDQSNSTTTAAHSSTSLVDKTRSGSTNQQQKSLEILLLEKNKAMQLDKTALLAKKRELDSEVSRLQNELKNLSTVNEQQKQLIMSLEEDLMRVHCIKRPEAEGAAFPDQSTLEVISDAVGYNQSTKSSNLSINNAESLLPVVTNQRERLRLRVQELEELNMQHQQHSALLNNEIERLRSDNVKLYEKIKFLQSYQGNQLTSSPKSDDILNKYSNDYEASLDPFQRFGAQERQRRYMALSTHDKATLSISRVIMSSGTARAAFFFYLIFLHCLVFMVLYRLAYTESCQRDAATNCVEKYREHMQMVHGRSLDHSHLLYETVKKV